jgi:hypothetical protein
MLLRGSSMIWLQISSAVKSPWVIVTATKVGGRAAWAPGASSSDKDNKTLQKDDFAESSCAQTREQRVIAIWGWVPHLPSVSKWEPEILCMQHDSFLHKLFNNTASISESFRGSDASAHNLTEKWVPKVVNDNRRKEKQVLALDPGNTWVSPTKQWK